MCRMCPVLTCSRQFCSRMARSSSSVAVSRLLHSAISSVARRVSAARRSMSHSSLCMRRSICSSSATAWLYVRSLTSDSVYCLMVFSSKGVCHVGAGLLFLFHYAFHRTFREDSGKYGVRRERCRICHCLSPETGYRVSPG